MKQRSTGVMVLFFCMILIFEKNTAALSPPDPLVQFIQCQGVVGLNFNSGGNNEQLAIFIIQSNSTTAFDVTFRFANRGKFKSGSREIPMTALVLDKISGTLGTGLTEPNDLDILNNLSGDEYVWDPGAGQTTETANYIIELRASWANPQNMIAGFYFESITVTLTTGL